MASCFVDRGNAREMGKLLDGEVAGDFDRWGDCLDR